MINEFIKRFNAKIMAVDFLITSTDDLTQVSSFAFDHFAEKKTPLKITVKNGGKRSLSQNAFQHVIYGEISKYLVAHGRTNWTPKFTKKNLKNQFLGWEDEEYIDVLTGEKSTRSVLRSTSELSKGDSFHFTTAILEWSESIGCFIKIPDGEYRDCMNLQTN